MTALAKLAPAASGALPGRFLQNLAGRDSTSGPALSPHARPSGDGHHAEGQVGTYTRRVTVNPDAFCVNAELKAWASSAPAKVLSLRTGISKSRIYDWRTERFGANAATMEIVRADKLANARAQIEQGRAVIRQSLGPLADLYPDAVNRILEG
jgi:hypothetical protein